MDPAPPEAPDDTRVAAAALTGWTRPRCLNEEAYDWARRAC